MNALRSLVFGFVALVAAGCGCGGGLVGSGVSKTETRDVQPYHRVEVEDALDVTLTDRAPETVSITADDNLVEHITTEVVDGALIIRVKDHEWLSARTTVAIEVSRVPVHEVGASGASHVKAGGGIACGRVAVSASGASVIELDAVVGEELVIWASGASHVSTKELKVGKTELKLSGASKLDATGGTLGALAAELSGASSLQASTAVATTASLDVSGGSQARLKATQSVSGKVSGGSNVGVGGNPAERTLESSGGSIVQYFE